MTATIPNPPATEPADPTRKMRRAALAAYAVSALISLVWGLSYDLFYDHGLQAEVRVGSTSEGSTFVTIHNGSPSDWTNVKVEADGRWFLRFDAVPAGAQRDMRLREFQNAYRLPRPARVFYWEGVAGDPEPAFAAPNFRPRTVRVTADNGAFETAVSF